MRPYASVLLWRRVEGSESMIGLCEVNDDEFLENLEQFPNDEGDTCARRFNGDKWFLMT